MLAIVKYKKSGNVYLTKATKNLKEYVVLECIEQKTSTILKPGCLVMQGKKINFKKFFLLDTEEKLGEFILQYKL